MPRPCPRCGLVDPGERLACAECGQPLPSLGRGLAGWSLILALASWPLVCLFGLGGLTALLAMLMAVVSLASPRFRAREGAPRAAALALLSGTLLVGGSLLLSWPALMRSRIAENERRVIGDLRTIQAAEAEYSALNRDLFDTLPCVATPSRCVPGRPSTVTAVTPQLASLTTSWGYVRTFHPGPAPAGGVPAGASPTSLTGFAYVAVPVSPGSTGQRSFCGDASGRICAAREGRPIVPAAGVCPPAPACSDL